MKKIRNKISSIQNTLFSQKIPFDRKVTTRRFFLSSLNVIFAHILNVMKQGSQPNIKLPKQVIAESKDSFSCSKGGGR